MERRIVVLGGGTGGTAVANRLRRKLRADVSVTVVDRDDCHVYQPGLLFVPFGTTAPDAIVRPRGAQLRRGIEYRTGTVRRVDVRDRHVHLVDGTVLGYDVLVVASGARLAVEETEGLIGPGWQETVHTFYDLDGSVALASALRGFDRGRLVVNVVDMPIKCPVAPLEFCFLADWHFRRRGVREQVAISYVTPLDGAFTRPVAARALGGLLEQKGIELVTEFNTAEVDGERRRLTSFDERTVDFDLAVVVPAHAGADYVGRSPGLGDELGFVPVNERTLQSKEHPSVFAVGDAAAVPASKAGSVAHFEAEVLVDNVERYLAGAPLDARFDGHTNCFIESGYGKALLIDFGYDTEPLPGHYPGRLGLPLLRESRLNHLGKVMFQPYYWHGLLPGRDIPGITSAMPRAGKDFDALAGASQ